MDTGTKLHNSLSDIYANDSVTVTQSPYFNPFRYAAEQSDKFLVRELTDIESLKQVVYIPSFRRRDGDGILAESSSFAGYQFAWKDQELKAIVATASLALAFF